MKWLCTKMVQKCMPKEEWEAVLDSRVMTLKEVEDKLGYKIRIVEGK